ncbi:hypothetical protein Q0M94_00685 [Deinococcus radiomollis]|uniref:hypothetical protein n=1 Tax=Deinococcus radiomollis TaxID=468916 RepID=UPI0038926941
MSEPSGQKQRSLYGLEGDLQLKQTRQAAVEKSISPFFRVFVPIFAGYAGLMSLLTVFISYGSFSPFSLLSDSIGIISVLLSAYTFYVSRFKKNLPLFVHLLLSMVLQACISTCRVAVNLIEGKSIDLFDWIVTPLLIILTLVVWFVTRNLRKTPQI